MINNPPRIAFDFPGTTNALGRSLQDVGDGDLRNINIVQAGDRTRMVMELTKSVGYDTQIDGKSLLITLQGAAVATTAATGITSAFRRAAPGDQKHSLRDIDFRRGRNGEGRIVVDLSDNAVGIDVRAAGPADLMIDFINAALPKNLERRLDVRGFRHAGADHRCLHAGRQRAHRDRAQGRMGTLGLSDRQPLHRRGQEGRRRPDKLVQGSRPGYTGEKLSLNFQNVEVRAVLQVIADFTGLNFITSDTVGGNLTLRLKDVPWDQALDIILQTKGLDMRKNGNVVWIAPRDELATQGKTRARGAGADRRPRAGAHRELPAQLPESRCVPENPGRRQSSAFCPSAAARWSTPAPTRCSCRTRRRGLKQCARLIKQNRRAGTPGHDRSAHRRSDRHVQPQPRRAARLPHDRIQTGHCVGSSTAATA